MITPEEFELIIGRLESLGYADDDIQWAESLEAPKSPEDFALEAIYVICNSGMRFTVARQIFERCRTALLASTPVAAVFGHPGKAAAIEYIWANRSRLFQEYSEAEDPLAFIASLPWIGGITKFHLAKNFGVPVVKPDVHLVRLASVHGVDPQSLCKHLAEATGYRLATVDTLLWRACAVGVIDSRTGQITVSPPDSSEGQHAGLQPDLLP